MTDASDMSCVQLYENVFDTFMISHTGYSLTDWQREVQAHFYPNLEQHSNFVNQNLTEHTITVDADMNDERSDSANIAINDIDADLTVKASIC